MQEVYYPNPSQQALQMEVCSGKMDGELSMEQFRKELGRIVNTP